jgi:hypothetical protein
MIRTASGQVAWDTAGFRWYRDAGGDSLRREQPEEVTGALWDRSRIVAIGADLRFLSITDPLGPAERLARVPDGTVPSTLTCHAGGCTFASSDGIHFTRDLKTISAPLVQGDSSVFAARIDGSGAGFGILEFGAAAQTKDGGKTWLDVPAAEAWQLAHFGSFSLDRAPDGSPRLVGHSTTSDAVSFTLDGTMTTGAPAAPSDDQPSTADTDAPESRIDLEAFQKAVRIDPLHDTRAQRLAGSLSLVTFRLGRGGRVSDPPDANVQASPCELRTLVVEDGQPFVVSQGERVALPADAGPFARYTLTGGDRSVIWTNWTTGGVYAPGSAGYIPTLGFEGTLLSVSSSCDEPVSGLLWKAGSSDAGHVVVPFTQTQVGTELAVPAWVTQETLISAAGDRAAFVARDEEHARSARLGIVDETGFHETRLPFDVGSSAHWLGALFTEGQGVLLDASGNAWLTWDAGTTWTNSGDAHSTGTVLCTADGCQTDAGWFAGFPTKDTLRSNAPAAPQPSYDEDPRPPRIVSCTQGRKLDARSRLAQLAPGTSGGFDAVAVSGLSSKSALSPYLAHVDAQARLLLGGADVSVKLGRIKTERAPYFVPGRPAALLVDPTPDFALEHRPQELLWAGGTLRLPEGVLLSGWFDVPGGTLLHGNRLVLLREGRAPDFLDAWGPCDSYGKSWLGSCGGAAQAHDGTWVGLTTNGEQSMKLWSSDGRVSMGRAGSMEAQWATVVPASHPFGVSLVTATEFLDGRFLVQSRALDAALRTGKARTLVEVRELLEIPACTTQPSGNVLRTWGRLHNLHHATTGRRVHEVSVLEATESSLCRRSTGLFGYSDEFRVVFLDDENRRGVGTDESGQLFEVTCTLESKSPAASPSPP